MSNQIQPTTYFLDGDLIYLREIRTSDADGNYFRWMNDTEITRYLESRFSSHSVEDLDNYISKLQGDKDNVFLAIITKSSDQHIGNIKLGPINWNHGRAEIGLVVGDKSYWGKGVGTEAIRLVTNYAFNDLNLHKLTAGCYSVNIGSGRAFEKAGFVQEGCRKDHCHLDDKYIDLILFGLVRTQA